MNEYNETGLILSIVDDFAAKSCIDLSIRGDRFIARVVVQEALFALSREFDCLLKAENKGFIVDQLIKMELKSEILTILQMEKSISRKMTSHMASYKNLTIR
jgi:hypothetical protein